MAPITNRCRVRNSTLRLGESPVTITASAYRLVCDCGGTVIWIDSIQSLARDNYPDVASAKAAGWEFGETAPVEEPYTCDACYAMLCYPATTNRLRGR